MSLTCLCQQAPAGAANLCPGCSDFWWPGSWHRSPRLPQEAPCLPRSKQPTYFPVSLAIGLADRVGRDRRKNGWCDFWLIWGRKYKHKYQPGIKTESLKVVENNRKTHVISHTLPRTSSLADPLPCKRPSGKAWKARSSLLTSGSCLFICSEIN